MNRVSEVFPPPHVTEKESQSFGDAFGENVDVVLPVDDISKTRIECGSCEEGDIIWERTSFAASCATDRYRCQTPSIGDCKKFGSNFKNIGADSVRAKSPYNEDSNYKLPDKRIVCTYNTNTIASDETALREWMSFRNYPRKWDNTLMSGYCKLDTDNYEQCPDGVSKCPRMMAGHICREWAESAEGKDAADSVMINWCKENPKSPLCTCIMRDNDQEYDEIRDAFAAVPVECWYRPCVDREMLNRMSIYSMRHPDCPKDVCMQVINIVNNKKVDMKNVDLINDCKQDVNETLISTTAAVGLGGAVILGVGLILVGILLNYKHKK